MITINISEQYREQFSKLLNLYNGNHDDLVSAIIAYKTNDLNRGIRNIEIDIARFEAKYKKDTTSFYNDFIAGKYADDNDDFIVWSGEYEVLQEYRVELEKLS
nr:hypothetical protein [Bacteroidota bacterium]